MKLYSWVQKLICKKNNRFIHLFSTLWMFSSILNIFYSASMTNTEIWRNQETEAVCLQPLSADLWLQVLIIAANFKGLVGSVPSAAACCCTFCVYVCVCARRGTKKWAVGWLPIVPVCACSHVSVCLYVLPPHRVLIQIWRGYEKSKRSWNLSERCCISICYCPDWCRLFLVMSAF